MAMACSKKIQVMVAIDESECSLYALRWALDNLRHIFVDSQHPHHLVIFSAQPLLEFTADLMTNLQEKQHKATLALLAKAKQICSNHGIDATTTTEVGAPKEIICKTVERLHVQLLILGSHGRGTIQRVLLGSVSDYCAHNAKCSVLIVKKPA